MEQCYRTRKTLLNPIVKWTDRDVWDFIFAYNIPYCSLYDEGYTRLGCIGCPLSGRKNMERDFERWPRYRELYIRAFEKMIENHPRQIKILQPDYVPKFAFETEPIDDDQLLATGGGYGIGTKRAPGVSEMDTLRSDVNTSEGTSTPQGIAPEINGGVVSTTGTTPTSSRGIHAMVRDREPGRDVLRRANRAQAEWVMQWTLNK